MSKIIITTCYNKKGLRELDEFEEFLRRRYVILCKSRCRNICSVNSFDTDSDDFAVNAYPTAVNDQISDSYTVE